NENIFYSRKWALLSTIMLILSPRLFAHSFFNSKDMIFLSLFTISVFSLLKFIEKRNFKITVIHALTTALAVDVRIPGVLLLALTWMGVGLSLCWPKSGKKEIKRNIVMLVIYTICALGFIVLFWPILWSNPIHHFVEAFQEMSKYPSDGKVLYFGKYVFSTQLPWHYVPGWIFITTPLLYSFLFIIGCCHLAVRVQQNKEIVFNAVILGWFFIPLMAVIIFKSVMYDAWRQMFFIYPALIIIAASGTRFLYDWIMKLQNRVKKRVSAIIFKSLLIGYLLSILVTMMQYHPFQNVYFNSVLGPDLSFVKYKFDLDYWGLSYRNALEYILRTDPSTQIPITAANSPGRTNALILPEEDRNRLVYVSHPEQAKYFLSNDRGRIEDYSFPNLYYGIDLDGARIMGVYKLK
ncbi:MAG: hypothetical protein KC733_12205, partial [Candidatus Omnitrophica bacterium]|nr:hypothetical protein [Candidatus Omnitrophota bacterium]